MASATSQSKATVWIPGAAREAAAAYESHPPRQNSRRRQSPGQRPLGIRRNSAIPEALTAYAEARERFTQLDEPGMDAVSWHQTAMVYQEARQPEAADAYRKSLEIGCGSEMSPGRARSSAGMFV
jgi:hypothetical protein